MNAQPENDVQDPAEPKRVETVVETHDASEETPEPAQTETSVQTTVTESSDSSE